MTTKTKETPAKGAKTEKKTTAPAPEFTAARELSAGNVPTDSITVTANVRKKFDEHAQKELAGSIKSKGIIQSLTVRPDPKKEGRYLLVAGERRLRAAKAAGLTEVPVRVLDLDDQAALLYQVDENLHRKDLGPIEEARGFKLLIKARKYDVDGLAQLIDKSKVYVYRAVSLLELPEEVIKAIEEGVITPAHGHQLLRVPEPQRGKVWKAFQTDNRLEGTVNDLISVITNEVGKQLARAAFPTDEPYAGVGACTGCAFNSTNQGALFGGFSDGAQCTNAKCFEGKTVQHCKDLKAAFHAEFPEAQDVGEAQGLYSLQQKAHLERAAAIEPDDLKKKAVRKALAEKKEDVYYGILGDQWTPPRLVVLTRDARLVDRALGRLEKTSSAADGSRPAAPKRDPKADFCAAFIQRELTAAAIKKAKGKKLELKDWQELAAHMLGELDGQVLDALFGPNELPYEVVKKADLNTAQLITFLAVRLGASVTDLNAKGIGVDVAAVKKAAKAAAEQAWADKQGTVAPGAKKK